MINTYTVLDLLEAETYGRSIIATQGSLTRLRERYHLSIRRLAAHIDTASQVVKRWEAEPDSAKRMQSMTAIRLGQFADHLDQVEEQLQQQGITPKDLVPIGVLASDMGLSPSSRLIAEKCRTGELTCLQLGKLGTYIPVAQAAALHRKEF